MRLTELIDQVKKYFILLKPQSKPSSLPKQRGNTSHSSSQSCSEVYSKPCQASKIEFFAKIANSYKTLTVFAKRFTLDV